VLVLSLPIRQVLKPNASVNERVGLTSVSLLHGGGVGSRAPLYPREPRPALIARTLTASA